MKIKFAIYGSSTLNQLNKSSITYPIGKINITKFLASPVIFTPSGDQAGRVDCAVGSAGAPQLGQNFASPISVPHFEQNLCIFYPPYNRSNSILGLYRSIGALYKRSPYSRAAFSAKIRSGFVNMPATTARNSILDRSVGRGRALSVTIQSPYLLFKLLDILGTLRDRVIQSLRSPRRRSYRPL